MPVQPTVSLPFRVKMQHFENLNSYVPEDSIALMSARSEILAAIDKDAQGIGMISNFPTSQIDTGNGCGGLGVPVLTGGRLSSRVALVHASFATRCLLRPGQYHLRDFTRS